MHQKCSKYALTNLLFGLCRSMWIIDPLVILPSPHHKALTCLSTPKMLHDRERTQFLSLFSFSDSHLNLSRNVGVRQLGGAKIKAELEFDFFYFFCRIFFNTERNSKGVHWTKVKHGGDLGCLFHFFPQLDLLSSIIFLRKNIDLSYVYFCKTYLIEISLSQGLWKCPMY
jgi:hypothetical protein